MPDDDVQPELVAGEVVSEAFEGPGDWLPPSDAARRIGVSERTLWRRVTAGQYRRKVVSGKAEILVPLAGIAPNTVGLTMPDTPDTMTLAVIEELRRARETDAERLALGAERIAALERENGGLSTAVTAYRREVEWLQAELERSRRPWWRRLLDG